MKWQFLRLGLLGVTGIGSFALFATDNGRSAVVGVRRFGRAAFTVGRIVADYKKTLYSGIVSLDSPLYLQIKSEVHKRSAEKLLELCCINGGAFIKVGQHLGSLEYLLPMEYVKTLRVLHSSAPQSPLDNIYKVLRQELKCEVDDLFIEFDEEPLGAASLAQVHHALRKDGKEVAVKVQHLEVKNHSDIDMKGMELLVSLVSMVFPDFKFEWLVQEMKRNLPLELDFVYEATNAEKVAKMYKHFKWLKIPSVHWDITTSRVLVMDFYEGGSVNDVDYMTTNNIDKLEVSEKIGKLYSEMIFLHGYVHCDPHPGNVLIRKNGKKADVVLLDHGLYTTLTDHFRLTYGKLWQSILNADLPQIKKFGEELGVGNLFGLFACMVTGRSWDSISKGIDKKEITQDEQNEIKGDAAKFWPEISEVLSRVPREMLLIFKTNDLLRGIEYSLNTQANMMAFITMSHCCVHAVYDHQRHLCGSFLCKVHANFSEFLAHLRISAYTMYLYFLRSKLGRYFSKNISQHGCLRLSINQSINSCSVPGDA